MVEHATRRECNERERERGRVEGQCNCIFTIHTFSPTFRPYTFLQLPRACAHARQHGDMSRIKHDQVDVLIFSARGSACITPYTKNIAQIKYLSMPKFRAA